jgi:hypothetical protein
MRLTVAVLDGPLDSGQVDLAEAPSGSFGSRLDSVGNCDVILDEGWHA